VSLAAVQVYLAIYAPRTGSPWPAGRRVRLPARQDARDLGRLVRALRRPL